MQHQVDLGGKTYTTATSILSPEFYDFAGPHVVNTATTETYGGGPLVRVGNGAIGPTGLLRTLCSGRGLTVEWVANTSRTTQIALQAGAVDVALTYEREAERRAEREGWSRTVGVFCHDHFVLAGPESNPAGLAADDYGNVVECFRKIGASGPTFHTRNDGSATMHKEHELFAAAGVEPKGTAWYMAIPGTPLEAMRRAEMDGAYMLVDRGTFLTAKRGGCPRTACYAEGAERLLNTAMLLTRSDERRHEVLGLVEWLMGPETQQVIANYGREWSGVPLFTPRDQVRVKEGDLLRAIRGAV